MKDLVLFCAISYIVYNLFCLYFVEKKYAIVLSGTYSE